MSCSKCSDIPNNTITDNIQEYTLLPLLDIGSTITNVSHLTNSDIDLHMPCDTNFNYFSTHDYHNNPDIIDCHLESNSFAALNCNIRSLSANHDKLVDMIFELHYPFSLIGVTETKLKFDHEPITNCNLPGYCFVSQPSHSNAGGVGFYIKNDIKFTPRTDLTKSTNEFEALWIEVQNDAQCNMMCGIIYRHPNGNNDVFNEYVNSLTGKIQRENKYCIIMGDFNLDLLKCESHISTNEFMTTLSTSFFQPYILQPTRITDHSATLIDNIFFNSLEHFTISGNIIYDLSDHLPNFLIISKLSHLSSNIKIFKRDYSKFDESHLTNEIQSVDWQELFSLNNFTSTTLFNLFYTKVSEIVDKHIPIRQLSQRELKVQSKPWITSAIRKSIQFKNKLYKKYLKTKSIYYHSKFKIYRNKLNHLLRISKNAYYNDYFTKNTKNSKLVWKGIKQIIRLDPKTYQTPTKITENNREITDIKEIADAMCKYFANIGDQLASTIPNMNKSPLDYMTLPNPDSFYIFPVTSFEIENEISKLKNGKATGPFSIPVKILKMLKFVISRPLEILFNASFCLGEVPDGFKIAKVIPVFKTGSQNCLNNYRPISLLSIFNKLLEKLMYNRLLNFLEKKNILYAKQFGFRANHSTDHAILTIIDKIQLAIEERDYSCGIFLDLSKAFDTIDHGILIKKMEKYGIRGIAKDWFVSYLENRQQFVSLNNILSDLNTVSCGVPQGSVLGPLLFLLYINDFNKSSKLLDFHLFADDSNLFFKHNNLSVLQSILNRELDNIHVWLCVNKLSLNVTKSNFVIFHPPQKKLLNEVKLIINGEELKRYYCIKYLGVLIDSHLNWKSQIECIAKKIKRTIGILSKLRYYVHIDILVNLYYALIYPFLVYGIVAWGNTYPTTLKQLHILQKKAIRTITFSRYDAHSSPLFKRLNIIKFPDLTSFYITIFMHKFHSNKLPTVFNNYFTPVNKIHNYNTRLASKQSYCIPKTRTNYGIFNLKYQGAKIWNSLDESMKTITIFQLKRKLKATLINSY